MKLISLNIWGGREYEPLLNFLKEHSFKTDIFCFQEVFSSSSGIVESRRSRVNILADLANLLKDFNYYFAPEQDGFDFEGRVDFDISFGQATFVKKIHQVDSEGSIFTHLDRNQARKALDFPANFHYVRFQAQGKKFVVLNFHGLSEPGSKLDTPERLNQSWLIKNFLTKETGAKILTGDFNLLPETQSIAILEENLLNLIKKSKIPRTRSRLSPFFGKADFQKFADYVLVSPEVKVINFEVPDVAVSDHLPMVLEFS